MYNITYAINFILPVLHPVITSETNNHALALQKQECGCDVVSERIITEGPGAIFTSHSPLVEVVALLED